jgi:hypothetical protein
MQYMLLIYDDEATWGSMSEADRNAVMGEYFAYTEELKTAGKYVAGDALQPISTAKSVRIREGDVSMTDGPFAETKEAVGGFDLIECGSLAEAVEIAASHPMAEAGTIEVRPLWGN